VSGMSQKSCVLSWRSVVSYWYKECRSRYDVVTLVWPRKQIYCKCMVAPPVCTDSENVSRKPRNSQFPCTGIICNLRFYFSARSCAPHTCNPVVISSIEGIQSTGFMMLF
jgi:hypothetical protein